jgi:hypothetical protein
VVHSVFIYSEPLFWPGIIQTEPLAAALASIATLKSERLAAIAGPLNKEFELRLRPT